MKALLRRFLRNESGATAIEYGLLIACIGMAVTFGIKSFSDALYNVYTDVNNSTQSTTKTN